MAGLRAALEAAGYGDVRTLLQSGNVVLTSSAEPTTTEHDLTRVLGDAFGFEIAVTVRTRDEMADVIERDPFGQEADDPARYQVSFLSAEPDAGRVDDLVRAAVAPERVVVHGREIYAWHPGGIARSDLAKLISDRRLGVGVTARNWRTVSSILELADRTDSPHAG